MKIKQICRLALVLLLTLALALVCACSGNGAEQDPIPGGTEQQTPSGDEKDPSGGEKDPSGSEKDPSGGEKDPSGSEKDPSGGEKDPSGSEKDPSGGEKDPSGEEKDPEPEPVYPEWKGEWVSAIFGGGPFVTGGEKVLSDVKASGFNTIIIWSVHVHNDGTLYLNDDKVCDNGKLVIGQDSLDFWAGLKGEDSSIERIELSVGAGNCTDFEQIKADIQKDGTGKETVLYKNMKLLIEATGADAVNYDDESCYDLDSAVKFGKMCAGMGVKITLCPYVNSDFWGKLAKELGEDVDRVYLQCYSGGQLNDNQYTIWWKIWALSTGLRIIPGYWCGSGIGKCSAATVKSKLSRETDYTTGGFIWYYDDLMKLKSPNSTKDYAAAINDANPHKGEVSSSVSAFWEGEHCVLPEKKRS